MVPASPDHAPAARGPLRPLTPQHEQEMCCCCFAHAGTPPSMSVSSFLGDTLMLAGLQHGRHTHRGQTPPKYEYTVKVEV